MHHPFPLVSGLNLCDIYDQHLGVFHIYLDKLAVNHNFYLQNCICQSNYESTNPCMQVNKQFLQSQYTNLAFVCVCIVWCHTLLTNSVIFRCIQ